MIYPNGDIEYCKGDTEAFRFNAKNNGVPCNLTVGDTYIFTVKRDKRETTPITFQKRVLIEQEQSYFDVVICKDDVKECCCGDYVYDVRRLDKNGNITTPRKIRKFKMCEVVGSNV